LQALVELVNSAPPNFLQLNYVKVDPACGGVILKRNWHFSRLYNSYEILAKNHNKEWET
jgi:hypothetical protein